MKNALNRLLFCSYYFLFWMIYFVVARFLFLCYYYENTAEIGFANAISTFFYGFLLDSSFAGYLSLFPFLLVVFSIFMSSKVLGKLIKFYTLFILAIINILLVVDAGLYAPWGIRLDATFLTYINTPEVMLASVSKLQLFLGFLFWSGATLLFFFYYKRQIHPKALNISKGNHIQIPLFIVLTAALIIPIRGGFQTIPINESNVYFSTKMFANHAALNFSWNFFNAISKRSDTKNPYVFFDATTAQQIINNTQQPLLTANTDSILNTTTPNVIVIIWESLTAKLVGPLGGEPDVTVQLNELSKEGILFTNFYGNGDRTDKGIPAILSGYYPQPTTSIIKMASKTRSLPFLSQKMIDLGYHTTFYYGGDMNFGNMNTYLRNGGITNFVDGSEFDKKDWNDKWGAHDHVFMQRFTDDLSKPQQEPFFTIALTLSSHEPFEFPKEYKFGKNTELNKLKSSHAYTDKAIGAFIANAKKQSWWDNTLIVIMADHGHGQPKHQGAFNGPKKFQIPMLWLGGALQKRNITIDHVSSQVDFSYTLLALLQGDNTDFTFGKNLFNPSASQYAYYNFNNGFGILDKNGTFVYDFVGNRVILEQGSSSKKLEALGKAISQTAYQDFLERR